jgi:tRNA threonylcarbamoyladenosine biosynthesis protein TsaE
MAIQEKNSRIAETIISTSPETTQESGRILGSQLNKNDIVAFFGDLGAGKTTFIKGLVEEVNGTCKNDVTSPTFVYMNIYAGSVDLYHFDLYRLKDEKQFMHMGFEEYLSNDGICLIEWAEKIKSNLPKNVIAISITHMGENKRKITISQE